MSTSFNENIPSFTIFTIMLSMLKPSGEGPWPISLVLPDPIAPAKITLQNQKLPSIFPEEPKKKSKTVTACPHSSRKHYAKNMCNNCYHRLGRDKTAWNCEHHDRKHYAKGMCQFCYLKQYNRSRHDSLNPSEVV